MDAAPLTRAGLEARSGTGMRRAPIRIIHLGLGAFHRAHQAWYTARVDTDAQWGIAAFTGRNPLAANEIASQDGLFTVIERSGTSDTTNIVTSIVEASDGSHVERLVELLADPDIAIVTITITEAGYRLAPDGRADMTDPVVISDLDLLRSGGPVAGLRSTLGRLLAGLAARRRTGGPALAIVPCDNMPENGPLVRAALVELAASVDPALSAWIAEEVAFVSTSVDRITPRTTPADLNTVAETDGWIDAGVVVTEPFHDWVLCGDFPAGRPRWEDAGARFVDEIAPFESRKLWLLNGAHSLLSYTARQRGHDTVAQAIVDPTCLSAVEQFWDEAVLHLPTSVDLRLGDYRDALLQRFRNTRIEHRLAQIANDGVAKLRIRIVPVILAERAAGRDGTAGVKALAGWISQVLPGGLLSTGSLTDVHEPEVRAASTLPRDEAIVVLLSIIDPRLSGDISIVDGVTEILTA
jgi:fructuronate reductase